MFLYQQIFFTTLSIAFGVLHLFLFIYNKHLKSNLYFSLFLFFYAASIFFDYQASLSYNETTITYLTLHRSVLPFSPIFALLFLYSAFNFKIPFYYWLIVMVLITAGVFAVIDPVNNLNYLQVLGVLVLFESIRIFTVAIKNNLYDAWILATGFGMLFLFSAYDTILDLAIIEPVYGITNGYPFGFALLIIFSSIYLARDFAKTNRKIITQERKTREMEISQKLMELEDKRKSKELEDARNVQLSMLPNCKNKLLNYEICFDMRTAAEVGGDYYDYIISEDEELSIVIGDATDHGMKAGMMVSIIKSLFLSMGNDSDIKSFFNKCSNTIKKMKLNNLYMALMLLKIKGGRVKLGSAGIPPILIYRKDQRVIEECRLKGMPLGVMESYPYEAVNLDINPGDTVLLMTDGLPELFNNKKEEFGYKRIKNVFFQNAERPVNEIILQLFAAGEDWSQGAKQNDDITLVAFRLSK